jgi:hypothetical protein
MTTSVWDDLEAEAEQKLIVNGRYVIDGKRYTRVTTFIGALDNAYGLSAWKCRNVALGITGSGALRAEVLGAGDNPSALDDICERAIQAQGSNEKRDLGSAIHHLTEMADAGTLPPLEDGDPLAWAISEYRRLIDHHGLEIIASEDVVINEKLGVAGRFDRIVRHDGTDMVLDIKTGKQKNASFARQFACYATADFIYDPATGERRPMHSVSQAEALAMMLPTDGESEGQILVVDIAKGWEDAKLCKEVRERGHRVRNDLVWPLGAVDIKEHAKTITVTGDDGEAIGWASTEAKTFANPLRPAPATTIDVADIEQRIAAIKATTHGTRLLRERWPTGITKPWPDDALGRIAKAVNDVEPLAAMPDDYWAVQDRFKALPADAHALGILWANEATAAGHKLSTGTDERHRRIVNAMCMLLEATDDAEVCRDVLGLAMADDIQPAVALGAAWAALTDDELVAVERFATAYRLGGRFNDFGNVVGDFDDAVKAMFGEAAA